MQGKLLSSAASGLVVRALIVLTVLAVPSTGELAQAENLREALIQTYNSNPTIMAERARLRALDEGVMAARAGSRPKLSGTAGFNQDIRTTRVANGRNLSAGVDLSLLLLDGGRVHNQVRAADERVLAGRANLRATEGDVFSEAVAAYMDVIRDRSIVTLNHNQVTVLETNLLASRDRFEVGDLTRTDVAQSEARLSLAKSNLATAQGRLAASEENYRRIIGALPGELQPPPDLPSLPSTADDAVEVALANNPDLVSIDRQIRAAKRDVNALRADWFPTISAVGSGSYLNNLGTADKAAGLPKGTLDNTVTAASVGVAASIPIYQGGLTGARVRQAQATQNQLQEQGVAIERAVIANARAAFSGYQAAREAITSNEIAVAANELALEGTKAEQTVGTRNVLDVLNAEQELLGSQVALVTARRDAYVAGFQLLNAMGRAEAGDLNLDGGALYDPVAHYKRSSGKILDWSDDPKPQPIATRTTPSGQTATTPVTEPSQ